MGKSKSIGSTYGQYVKDVGKDNAYPRQTYLKVLRLVFKKLAQRLIQKGPEGAEWRLEGYLGYLSVYKVDCPDVRNHHTKGDYEISFNELTGGKCFFMKWHIYNKYTRLRHRTLWRFAASRGNSDAGTGQRGLTRHVLDAALDPRKPRYDIINKTYL